MSFEQPLKPEVLAPLKSLTGLAFILRHKELWPKGFQWEYNDCDKCAMGLAYALFDGRERDMKIQLHEVGHLLGFEITYPVANIFLDGNLGYGVTCGWKVITPEMVADKIDAYVAKMEGR